MLDMTGEKQLLFRVDGEIATVAFNRPKARNALTFEMYSELAEICSRVGQGDNGFARIEHRLTPLTGASRIISEFA